MEERLNKWKLPDLHRLMDLVDLPRGSGDKVSRCSHLVELISSRMRSAQTEQVLLWRPSCWWQRPRGSVSGLAAPAVWHAALSTSCTHGFSAYCRGCWCVAAPESLVVLFK